MNNPVVLQVQAPVQRSRSFEGKKFMIKLSVVNIGKLFAFLSCSGSQGIFIKSDSEGFLQLPGIWVLSLTVRMSERYASLAS
jgi:hypothetical protein